MILARHKRHRIKTAGNFGFRIPAAPLGTILKETGPGFDSGNALTGTNYPITGTGITKGTNRCDMTGNPTLFSSYVSYADPLNVHVVNGLEEWDIIHKFTTPAVINGANSFGVGIGRHSDNAFDPFTSVVRWVWDNGLARFWVFYNKDTLTGQIQGGTAAAALTPVANTAYWIRVKREFHILRCSVYDATLSLEQIKQGSPATLMTDTFILNLGTAANYIQLNNVGKFVFHQFGGDGTFASEWHIFSDTKKYVDIMGIGDSNMYGIFSELLAGPYYANFTTPQRRWFQQAMILKNITNWAVSAGMADRFVDVLAKISHLIALRPKLCVISCGVNDLRNSRTVAQILADMRTTKTMLNAAGIAVIFTTPFATSAVSCAPLAAAIIQEFGVVVDFYGLSVVSNATTMKPIYDSNDNLHGNFLLQRDAANLLLQYI